MTTKDNKEPQPPNLVDQTLSGWQKARVLMTANHLNFFTALGEEPLSAEEIASRCGTHPRSTRLLLNACVALGFLEKQGPLYHNSAEVQVSLVRGKPNYRGDGIAHQEDLWQSWSLLNQAVRTNSWVPTYVGDAISHQEDLWKPGSSLDEVVRTNRQVEERDSLTEQSEVHRHFMISMQSRAIRWAPTLAETLDLSGRRQLFDVGGGPGTLSIFLVKRYPGLKAIVFDLPQTIEFAKEIISEFGVSDLVTTRSGDYFKDDFGQGNDVVLLSTILRLMGPERSQGLLQKAYDSLVPGGLVVINEGLIDDEGTSPLRAVMFSLNMLVTTGNGQSHSGTEITKMMEAVGFVEPRIIPLLEAVGTSLIIGDKP